MRELLVVVVNVHFDCLIANFFVCAVKVLEVLHGAFLGMDVRMEWWEVE